jgi:hypothetical protein
MEPWRGQNVAVRALNREEWKPQMDTNEHESRARSDLTPLDERLPQNSCLFVFIRGLTAVSG